MFISPQIKSYVSKHHIIFFINYLKSHVGDLYKLNIINWDDLVYGSMSQIPISFLLNYVIYYSAETNVFTNKNTHTSRL